MRLLFRLFNVHLQYLTKRDRYARARLFGKLVRLAWVLVCVAAAVALAYGARVLLAGGGLGGLFFGWLFVLLAAVFFLAVLSACIQYAIIGFAAARKRADPAEGRAPGKKTDILFGAFNLFFLAILIAGDLIVILL